MNRVLKKIICVIPVYNDWESFSMLVSAIENTYCIPQKKFVIDIIAINDGSFEENELDIKEPLLLVYNLLMILNQILTM